MNPFDRKDRTFPPQFPQNDTERFLKCADCCVCVWFRVPLWWVPTRFCLSLWQCRRAAFWESINRVILRQERNTGISEEGMGNKKSHSPPIPHTDLAYFLLPKPGVSSYTWQNPQHALPRTITDKVVKMTRVNQHIFSSLDLGYLLPL